MPKFRVLRRVDAYADYVADVQAATAKEAAVIASEAEEKISWQSQGIAQFDARLFVTLDANGSEIEGTEVGDFA